MPLWAMSTVLWPRSKTALDTGAGLGKGAALDTRKGEPSFVGAARVVVAKLAALVCRADGNWAGGSCADGKG